MTDARSCPTLAAIDVGTNAARLELVRQASSGTWERVLKEREAIRPGEGVFATGRMSPEAVERLVATLGRFAAVCRRHQARVRAVATSALRESGNQREILHRVREETGLELEVVSGEEEARLICLGVLHRTPAPTRSLLVDLGGGSTEVVLATGERPHALWSLPLGAVRLTHLFDTAGEVSAAQLQELHDFTRTRLRETLPTHLAASPVQALGSSGTIRAVVGFASPPGAAPYATREQLARAARTLAKMKPAQRREHFEPQRADIIVAGAVLLDQVVGHLGLAGLGAVKSGLREGLLVDLGAREAPAWRGAPPPPPGEFLARGAFAARIS